MPIVPKICPKMRYMWVTTWVNPSCYEPKQKTIIARDAKFFEKNDTTEFLITSSANNTLDHNSSFYFMEPQNLF